jgi:hypothetical protein
MKHFFFIFRKQSILGSAVQIPEHIFVLRTQVEVSLLEEIGA